VTTAATARGPSSTRRSAIGRAACRRAAQRTGLVCAALGTASLLVLGIAQAVVGGTAPTTPSAPACAQLPPMPTGTPAASVPAPHSDAFPATCPAGFHPQ
jgi:hypothetical protein